MSKHRTEPSHRGSIAKAMYDLRPGLLTVFLALALGVVGANRQAAGDTPADSGQVKAKYTALSARVTQRETAARRAAAAADRRARELTSLHTARLSKERQLRLLVARVAKARAEERPHPSNAGAQLVTATEVEQREAAAKQAATAAEKLARELAALLQAHADKEQQLKVVTDRLQRASAALARISRSRADLDEELARAKKALDVAETQKVALLSALNEAQQAFQTTQNGLNVIQGWEAGTVWQPKNTIEFVCRKHQIVELDLEPLNRRLNDMFGKLSDEVKSRNKKFTVDEVVTRINNLELETASFAMRALGGYQNQSAFILLTIQPKFGDEWENADRLANADSSFCKKLAGASTSTTGIQFIVWDDSFDTYLRAVTVATKKGFRSRWQPYAADEPLRKSLLSNGPGDNDGWGPDRNGR